MEIMIFENEEQCSKRGATFFAAALIKNPKCVMGFATGSTPIGLYQNLVRYYNEGIISFNRATSFNLDEYIGIDANHPESYQHFMKENLFKHVDFREGSTHLPNSQAKDISEECARYDTAIAEKGPIDIQVLGIGRNGHIGFNEPSDTFPGTTHIADLQESTIQANARFFEDISQVPTQAITMGIKTIMQAKKIILLAFGEDKAEAVKRAIEGEVTPLLPASVLQFHQNVTFILDSAAACRLEK